MLLRTAMLRVLIAALPPTMPHVTSTGPNANIFLLATALWAIVSLVPALLPVAYARRRDIHATLATLAGKSMSGGPRQERSRAALVVAEIALAVALVTTAGLLARSFWNLRHVDPGFDVGGVSRRSSNFRRAVIASTSPPLRLPPRGSTTC